MQGCVEVQGNQIELDLPQSALGTKPMNAYLPRFLSLCGAECLTALM